MFDKLKKIRKKQVQSDDTIEVVLEEKDQLTLDDTAYIENSAEAVGYDNREIQWSTYRTVLQYIPENSSILDFGCGRGDLYVMHKSEYGELDYTGVDLNEPLLSAGKKIYSEISDNLILSDWFNLPKDLAPRDWCISIGSNNLRYDANIKLDDFEYLCKTIDVMYEYAIEGLVLVLTSGTFTNGLINHDPGKILNWAQKKYGLVCADHTVSRSAFCLIIKK